MKISPEAPKNDSTVELLTENQKNFLENRKHQEIVAENADWLNLVRKGEEDSIPAPVKFEFSTEGLGNAEIFLVLSENAELSDAKRFLCAENSYEVYNLLIGKEYHWRLEAFVGNEKLAETETFTFTTSSATPRSIFAGGLSNIRDLGGYDCDGGRRVKQGMIYRGCEMEFHHTITEHGIRVLRDELKIRTDLDLRQEAVDKVTASALGDTVDFVLIPTLAYEKFFEEKETCKKLFDILKDESYYPVYTHCWGGADRTGTFCLLILAILGVDKEDLFADYEYTSLSIWGKRSIHSYHFEDLLASLDNYGSENDSINEKCRNFLRACGISDSDMAKIYDILTEEKF